MQDTQSFRIASDMANIETMNVDNVDGENIIYWEDIEQVFQGVQYIRSGDTIVKLLRDRNGNRYVPHRIGHYPGIVLDVVMPTTSLPSLAKSTEFSRLDHTKGQANITTHGSTNLHSPSAAINEINIIAPSDSNVTLAESVSRLAIAAETPTGISSLEIQQTTGTTRDTSHTHQQLKTLYEAIELASESGQPLSLRAMQELIRENLVSHSIISNTLLYLERNLGSVVRDVGELKLQGSVLEQLAHKMIEMQQQALDRLTLIQSKTEAILTQQVELAEYPIPRLFIVLPEEPTKYDPSNWFRTKFRLHFICECGEHTKVAGSKLPDHLHLAKHEGYLVREPTKFFKKYGPFLLLMLELIKTGINVAGCVVPALASMKVTELVDSAQETAKNVIDIKTVMDIRTVIDQIDYSLKCIDKQLENDQASSTGDANGSEHRAPTMQQYLVNYLNKVEAIEGVELRQLGSFLKTSKEDNILGNLYRMTTSDGHVKWVCYDHYRAGYQEAHTQKLRDLVNLAMGEFNEQLGRISIKLTSSFAAAQLFDALHKARGALELTIELHGECTRSDLDGLVESLRKSRISILRLVLSSLQTTLGSRLLSTSARYEALFRISELPNLKLVHFALPKDVKKILHFQSKRNGSNHFRLSIDMNPGSIGQKDFLILVEKLKTNSTLTSLDLTSNSIGDIGGQALGEALTTNSTLTTLYLMSNSIGDIGGQALGEALKTNSSLATLDLTSNSIGDIGGQALGEALKTNSTLVILDLKSNLIGNNGAHQLSEALKTNKSLTTLDLQDNSIGEKGSQVLAEALKTNSTLIFLDLTSNSIGEIGGQALGEALKTNSTLTTLDLTSNSIGDIGGQALGEALRTNSTLTFLDLMSNSIGVIGGQALSEALKTNSTLTSLNLESNSIGDIGGQALSEALKTNSTLTSLYLASNSIGDIGRKALDEAIKTNSTLTCLDLKYILTSSIPEGWERRVTPEGRSYYVDHNTELTSWIKPKTSSESHNSLITSRSEALPVGWERRVTPEGRVYFVDQNSKSTSWIKPKMSS
ncbi:hypothetical protein BGZ98_009243 [Dissophora globulifera]|nr:hypothetical protein BGZ98_009243 [Dissophora globulifera]